MSKTLYIGIDVSKNKLDTSTTINPNNILAFSTFENNPSGFKKLIIWANRQRKNIKFVNMHFCIESTGIYSEEITEYLQEQEHTKVSLINPAQSKAFANSRLLRTKNDKVDSSILAFYCAINKPKETPKALEELKELKRIVRYEDFLIEYRAKLKTKLSSVKNKDIIDSVNRLINSHIKEIEAINKQINNHIKQYTVLKKSVEILSSIKNISTKTASRILVEIVQEENAELTVKKQVAHAGLAPGQKISGISVKGKPKICKTGNSRLRKYLYMPTVGAIVSNPIIKNLYERLISKGKHKMVALIACMKKLLSIAIGVLRNKKPFDLEWANKKQLEYLNAA